MKAIVNTNITTKALTIKKENSLAIIHNVVFNTIRISKKSLCDFNNLYPIITPQGEALKNASPLLFNLLKFHPPKNYLNFLFHIVQVHI